MKKNKRNSESANAKIQWHPGFYAAMQLELKDDKQYLEFQEEVPLNQAPLLIDVLIIKKKKEVRIKNEIGHLFKGHNIVEYKSPDDELGIDAYFKAYAYACLYKAYAETENAIPAEDVTLTLIRQRLPKKLLAYFKDSGYQVTEVYPGIYHIKSERLFDTQIITGEVSENTHIYLKALRKGIERTTAENLLKNANRLTEKAEKGQMDALLQVVTSANKEEFKEWKGVEYMCEALRELMADEIEEGIAKGIAKGRAEGIAKGRAEGIAEGRAEGRAEGKFKMLLDLIHDGTLTMAVAATKAGLSEEAFIGKLKEYKLLPNNS